MATYNAIAATSEAIIRLLREACPRNEFGKAEFAFYQGIELGPRFEEGISLFLYRVTVNTSFRNAPPRVAPDGTQYRQSLPLDLHYVLTAWAPDPQMQQRLLGWSMRILEDTAILSSNMLNRSINMPNTFRPEEVVELSHEPLSLEDQTAVFDKLIPRLQTSVTYLARLVSIDSTQRLSDPGLVRIRPTI